MRRLPMSRDKELASWSCCHFLIDILDTLRSVQRLQAHRSPCKVKIDNKVPQEVPAENSTLSEPCGLVYGFHVKHRRVDLLQFAQSQTDTRQLQKFNVLSDSCRSKHAHLRRLQQIE